MQYQPTLRLRQIDDVLNEIPQEALGELIRYLVDS